MVSARGEYPHAIRLNYGHPWTADTERAVATLGTLIREQRTRRSRRDS
jgi:DNA-binding transcriptional MocR family regulator